MAQKFSPVKCQSFILLEKLKAGLAGCNAEAWSRGCSWLINVVMHVFIEENGLLMELMGYNHVMLTNVAEIEFIDQQSC